MGGFASVMLFSGSMSTLLHLSLYPDGVLVCVTVRSGLKAFKIQKIQLLFTSLNYKMKMEAL